METTVTLPPVPHPSVTRSGRLVVLTSCGTFRDNGVVIQQIMSITEARHLLMDLETVVDEILDIPRARDYPEHAARRTADLATKEK